MAEWQNWSSGVKAAQRFEAPVEIPGWSERPWVAVRALTEAEALEQESLGLIEEYELVQRGLGEPELRVRRVYDLVAMAEYEWGRCLVDWCLPEDCRYGEFLTPCPSPKGRGENAGFTPLPPLRSREGESGVTVEVQTSLTPSPSPKGRGEDDPEGLCGARRMAVGDHPANLEFLRGMGPALGRWVKDVLDTVNCRRPEQRAEIETAKKELKELGALGSAGLMVGPGQILQRELPRPDLLWREGHEFRSQTEAASFGGLAEERCVSVPGWVWLVMEALRELRLAEAAGGGTSRHSWNEQPAWRVELWEAFWWGRLRARAAQERERL